MLQQSLASFISVTTLQPKQVFKMYNVYMMIPFSIENDLRAYLLLG